MAGNDADRSACIRYAKNPDHPDHSSGGIDTAVFRIYEKEKVDQIRRYEIKYVKQRKSLELF